jgi:hypothetical protein
MDRMKGKVQSRLGKKDEKGKRMIKWGRKEYLR